MSEYVLDRGTRESAAVFESLDAFTQAYIAAMFWTDCGPDSEDMSGATFAELAPDALDTIKADCAAWQAENAALLAQAYAVPGYGDETHVGHDYWLTRNGHGTGFWDRGLGALGDLLSAACRGREVWTYRGDDGLIYVS